MLRRFSFTAFLLVSVLHVRGGSLPLTTKDVSLMLRAGDSNTVVMRELATRKFVDKLDPEKENVLVKAGANAELIAALRQGTYSLSAEQAAKAEQKIVEVDKRRAEQAEESIKLDAMQKSQQARKNVTSPLNTLNPNATADYLKGCLVQMHNGKLVPLEDDVIVKKKFIAYYFSAHWCGPCRQFTPKLVDYYNHAVLQHPEFEIVFVSSDRTAEAMESYMRETNMPWPAIIYAKRGDKPEIQKAAGNGIPSLVLVESNGKLISSAFDGEQYRGPQKVLDDLDAIFAGKTPTQVAQAH